MIKTIGDLLERLRVSESLMLAAQDIKHAPTIGAMYEGLTKHIIDRALPVECPVEVSAGFITDDSGALSDELDCLVVTAPGCPVPYTDKREFHVDDVIAVVQVKKNLYSRDLASGFHNLASVRKLTPDREKCGLLFKHAYQSTTLQPVPDPRTYQEGLSHELQMLYCTLAQDVHYPARIVFGYDGFTTQSALRDSFFSFLEGCLDENGHAKGYGVHSLPSMICCGQHSLVKCNGMPFISPLDCDGYWPVFCSTSVNPTRLVLELLWTRLVYSHLLSGSVFDEDDQPTPMNRFLDARPRDKGWEYRYFDMPDAQVNEPPEYVEWSPAFIDDVQVAVLSQLDAKGAIGVDDADFCDFLESHGYTVDSMVESLKLARLANVCDGLLVYLTDECTVVYLPDGRIAAADNRAGELTRWLLRQPQSGDSGAGG